jgi:hypothetical protein
LGSNIVLLSEAATGANRRECVHPVPEIGKSPWGIRGREPLLWIELCSQPLIHPRKVCWNHNPQYLQNVTVYGNKVFFLICRTFYVKNKFKMKEGFKLVSATVYSNTPVEGVSR